MEKQTREKKKTLNKYQILMIVFAVIFAIVVIIAVRNWIVQRNALKEYEKLASQVNELQGQINDNAIEIPSDGTQQTTEAAQETQQESQTEDTQLTEEGIEIPQKNLDWTKLHNVNADIYAWIYIPGTDIDYPVLQHPADDTHYLNYNMNGTRGYPGCIYTERANSKDFTDFDTVIYGHNMRNDSMFTSLHKYGDQTFFNNFPYVYIYTEDKVLVYEIFAAYQSGNEHILHTNDFSTEEGRQAYLESIVKNTEDDAPQVRNNIQLSVDSHLLTLSTCVNRKADKRFLVQAVLLNEDQL